VRAQPERGERLRAGDAVDDEPVRALEPLHRAARLRAVDAVGRDPERPLQRDDAGAAHGRLRRGAARSPALLGDGAAGQQQRRAEHGDRAAAAAQAAQPPAGVRAAGARAALRVQIRLRTGQIGCRHE
jgi:hypothetical protein